VKIWNK
jgi:hypothetical protein